MEATKEFQVNSTKVMDGLAWLVRWMNRMESNGSMNE